MQATVAVQATEREREGEQKSTRRKRSVEQAERETDRQHTTVLASKSVAAYLQAHLSFIKTLLPMIKPQPIGVAGVSLAGPPEVVVIPPLQRYRYSKTAAPKQSSLEGLPGPGTAAHIPGKHVIRPFKPPEKSPISHAHSNLWGVTQGNPCRALLFDWHSQQHSKFFGPVISLGRTTLLFLGGLTLSLTAQERKKGNGEGEKS